MSKAMLIMDMPKCCTKCPLFEEKINLCGGNGKMMECGWAIRRQEWCPLHEIPNKEKFPYSYNACIDEILGGRS
ncbi:MAG: hypothetical protein IJ439_03670 [Tyzzerella sp.]|nr:hypothetical protein [Tyzzerella sp.]